VGGENEEEEEEKKKKKKTTKKKKKEGKKKTRKTFSMAQQPIVDQGLLIIEASRSHSDTPHSVGVIWTSDQPDAEKSS
jgi:hypothetical protein